MAWQKVKVPIPRRFGPTERQAIAQEVIDFIVERTKSGKNIKGGAFPGYSASYKGSLDFKIAGKGGTVDLTLSGEMLDSIQLLAHKSGEIEVGFDRSDKELNGKAEGNQTGSYGTGKAKKSKARPFLGITGKDLKVILDKYPSSREDSLTRATDELAAALAAGDLVDGIDFEGE